MKIALTVITRSGGIEIEKRFESEVDSISLGHFIEEPGEVQYINDPVLEAFQTLTKAYRDHVEQQSSAKLESTATDANIPPLP